jgi:hypothetical protein
MFTTSELDVPPPWPYAEGEVEAMIGGLESSSADEVDWSYYEHASTTAELSDAQLVDEIVEEERLSRVHSARRTRLTAELARRRPGDERGISDVDEPSQLIRWAPDELGCALGLSRLTAKARLVDAARLVRVLPRTLHAWEQGLIDEYRARSINDLTMVVSDEAAVVVESLVLADAGDLTWSQLRAALREAVLRVDPDGGNVRHREARKRRRVEVYPEDDGMAALRATMPATDARLVWQHLTALAGSLADDRSIDQRRADLVADLLTGRLTLTDLTTTTTTGDCTRGEDRSADPDRAAEPGDSTEAGGTDASVRPTRGPRPHRPLVQIVVGLDTLTGTSNHPAQLTGYGPIPADLARQAATDGVWRRLVTDPLSGALLDHGRTTYRPPTALAEYVKARDQHCRYPICSRHVAELDHHTRWADGGPTDESSLHGYCTHHHWLKEQPGWHVLAHPDGTLTWITPTGRRYLSKPHDYRPLTSPDPPPAPPPADDPPPF